MGNILFRADAGGRLGIGHVMRCLALAEAFLARGQHCHLVAAEIPEALAKRLAAAGIIFHRIDRDTDQLAEATLNAARDVAADGIVLDGYGFDDPWRLALAASGIPVLALSDDAAHPPPGATLILDAAASPIAGSAWHLYGPGYTLLRREFSAAARLQPRPMDAKASVLVTFGGTDPAGLTLPVCQALRHSLGDQIDMDVVIGGGVPAPEALAATVTSIGGATRAHLDPQSMAALMVEAGLAVSAAGGTMNELAALGVPSILVIVADNQRQAAAKAATQGWCRVVDGQDPQALDLIARHAAELWADVELRRRMAMAARATVEIDGADRVAEALLAKVEERLAATS